MRARLIVPLAGSVMREIGDIVEGDEALRLCMAEFAVPVSTVTEVETASTEPVAEKATRRRK